jgi:hypothetical protein
MFPQEEDPRKYMIDAGLQLTMRLSDKRQFQCIACHTSTHIAFRACQQAKVVSKNYLGFLAAGSGALKEDHPEPEPVCVICASEFLDMFNLTHQRQLARITKLLVASTREQTHN